MFVGSTLTGLKWDLELLEKDLLRVEGDTRLTRIKDMAALIDHMIISIRRISTELRPSILDDLGLVAAVQSYLLQFQERAGIETGFEASFDDAELTSQQSTALFRVFEEALTNVLRHARASAVKINLERDNDDLVLTIRDNGHGITEAETHDRLSLGLLGMREHVNLIGGGVSISGIEGEGTVVTVRVPTSSQV
jgi:signal transduction histidine kinase